MLDYILAYLHFGESEEGQTMAEYAVVLAVITVVVIAALTALSGGINKALGDVTAKL
ncbi:MAG: Flp/Fap pilin component [Thermoleophilia bacterium]|nr:Flp/Fap pilin component [Thermoleophilia bacterium]